MLANFTADKINSSLPDIQFQCYAYSGHADIPSSNILINKNIDVQVIPFGFQFETSGKGLLNRWYSKHSNISEYHYLNIPQWTGETPLFSLNEYKNTILRIKEKGSQGIVIETSPAKFASLPFLYAGNRLLVNDISIDSSLSEFVYNLFPGVTGDYIKQLFKNWGDENVATGGSFTLDNKYKIPLFVQQLNKAVASAKNADKFVMQRLQELKAYLHYIILYYDLIGDNMSYLEKSNKTANLCLYLAKINKLQLVNSYFLILDMVNKYPVTNTIYKEYNIANGTAYNNGNLSLITDQEIDKNFSDDVIKYTLLISDYNFQSASVIIAKMNDNGLKPLDKINVKIGYTYGYNYNNRSEFYFYAPAAGSVNINCVPHFELPESGFVNITVEADDKPLLVLKDEKITPSNNPGNILINIPSPGIYKLSFVSQFKTGADIIITTNGNTFFKNGPFYGNRIENYRDDNWRSFPKYFYVPNISQLYFSINNACYTNTCLSPLKVENAFGIKDNTGKDAQIETSSSDSSLYQISVSSANASAFWKVNQMREYNLCFANISNIEIFAEQKPEAAPLPVLQNGIVIYPNPSKAVFNFKKKNLPLLLDKINIYDPQGKKIMNAYNANSVDLTGLPAGIYIFSAQKENDIIKGKLIKN